MSRSKTSSFNLDNVLFEKYLKIWFSVLLYWIVSICMVFLNKSLLQVSSFYYVVLGYGTLKKPTLIKESYKRKTTSHLEMGKIFSNPKLIVLFGLGSI